jgi:putative SbcD/Mre11-related phosphoesterase
MEISSGIKIVGTGLLIAKENTLVINDLHLGYEEYLLKKGVLLPKSQLERTLENLEKILKKTKPKKIILNGDIKHEFGKVLRQEWKEVVILIEFLQKRGVEVIIVKGNHDRILEPIATRKGVEVVKEYNIGRVRVVHGDELVKLGEENVLIIGHEHPAITIREGSKQEKYKCFLRGKYFGKELIVLPSFNPLLEGTDILKEKLLSPFLKKIDDFEVYVVNERVISDGRADEEAFDFGKVRGMRKMKN